jgi:hypothetical protein
MADVIDMSRARAHYRASSDSDETRRARRMRDLADSSANLSAVNPAERAVLVRNSGTHQASGMLFRCHHLLTMNSEQPPPTSDAQSTRLGQSSMIDLNDGKSGMPTVLRQPVLDGKPNVSRDCGNGVRQNVFMADESASAYKAGFLGRVKAARELRYSTQEEIAEVLGMPQPKYSKYETRSLMPHQLLPRFCKACGVTMEWLIAGKGAGPAWKPREEEPKPRQKSVKRRRAA